MNSFFELQITQDNTQIKINPMLLAIKEFETIWKNDKTKDKSKALKELTYIYGMCSSKDDNIWKDYTDLKQRSKVIIQDIFGENSTWTPSREVLLAIEKYKERIPKDPSEMLLDTLKGAIMKIKDHIDSIDYSERDNNNRPVNNPKDVIILANQATKTYMDIEEIIERIKSNKKLKSDKLKGGSEEGIFETDNFIKKLI